MNFAADAARLIVTSNDSFNAKSNEEKVALFHQKYHFVTNLYHEYFVTRESIKKCA